jgi:hypothetical protein
MTEDAANLGLVASGDAGLSAQSVFADPARYTIMIYTLFRLNSRRMSVSTFCDRTLWAS